MSHFSVITIGNPNDVLAPFNEQDEEYFAPVDNTEEYKKDYEKYHTTSENWLKFLRETGEEDNIVNFMKWWTSVGLVIREDDEDSIARAFASKENSFIIINKDGELVHYYYFHNPNAKWDWWQDGGRFGNGKHFIFKDGHESDCGLVAELDVDAMIAKAKANREKDYDEVIKKFKRRPKLEYMWKRDILPAFDAIDSLVPENATEEQINKAKQAKDVLRNLYNSQPDVKKWKKLFPHDIFCSIEDYCMSRNEFVSRFELPCWAICDEDGWYEPTEMGWWGLHDDYEPVSWREKAIEVLRKNVKRAQEDPDYEGLMVSLIDCHI